MSAIFRHELRHTCMPALAQALSEIPGILFGTVVRCPECKRTWMLTPRRLWLRRHIVNAPGCGHWVREPWGLRVSRRRDMHKSLNVDLTEIMIKAARRR